MVLADAVTKLQMFVWIFNHASRVMTWSPACSTLELQTWSNNQSQHDLLYGGVSLSITLNLKLAQVPYTTPKWPTARCKDICDRYCIQKRNNDHFLYSYLPLLSLRWKVLHYLLSRINKLNRDFLHWNLLLLVCHLRNYMTLHCFHPYARAKMADIVNKVY